MILIALLLHGFSRGGWNVTFVPVLGTDDTPPAEARSVALDEQSAQGMPGALPKSVCPRVPVPVPVRNLDGLSAEAIAFLLHPPR